MCEILFGRVGVSDSTALIDLTQVPIRRLSFAWLDSQAASLAASLEPLIHACTAVGLLSRRSAEAVAGMLAIWRLGAIYLPLDVDSPLECLRFLIEDSCPEALLAQAGVVPDASLPPIPVVRLESAAIETAAGGNSVPSPTRFAHPSASDCAYIMYTSGSTGTPKGVLGSRRGLLQRCEWMWAAYPFAIDGSEVCAQKTALTFVDSLWESVGPLGKNVPLLLLPPTIMQRPADLARALSDWEVTRIVLVPAALRMLLDAAAPLLCVNEHPPTLSSLRFVSVSGDAFPLRLAALALSRLPYANILNLYGSTEVSADVTCWDAAGAQPRPSVLTSGGMPRSPSVLSQLRPPSAHAHVQPAAGCPLVCPLISPLGLPVAGSRALLLQASQGDGHAAVVTLTRENNLSEKSSTVVCGVGEIAISGDCLSFGYLHRTQLTEAKFVTLSGSTGRERWFRTGDLGEINGDGMLCFAGRLDRQLKLNGSRVEPREVRKVWRAE
jgi:non-ribosomal peptide synthetase component F